MEYNKEEVRERFKELFEYSLDLIYVNDLNGNFLDANEVTLITLGYDHEDIPHISFLDLLDSENLMKAYKFTKEIRKTGKQSQWSEYKIKTKEGDNIFIETYGIPLTNNGKIYAILGIGKNVTERKVAELKLKDSEEMFKAIYKEGPIPAYTWQKLGNDFILIDFNNAAEEISKEHVKNFIGFKASVIYKDRPDILNYLRLCMVKKERISAEIKYKFKLTDEEKQMFAYFGYVNPELIVEHAEDITERKNAILKLQESEEKYRNMINNLDVGFYQVTLDGIMLNHNPAHNKIMEYDPLESLIGKNVHMFWQYPEQRDIYKEKLFKDGFAKNYACYAQTRTGKKIIVELNSHLILDMDGKPIRIDGTFIDITEKYILSEKLRESERKYRYLYENTPFSILLINSQGIIVDCNPKTESMFDKSRDEFIGKKIQDTDIFSSSDLLSILDLFKRFLSGEDLHRVDFRVIKNDEIVIWVNLQASIMKIGEETYVQALFTDVTLKREAELLVNEENRKLKELEKIRKNLISRVSHELKTPLVSISGGTELLLTAYNKDFSSEALDILELIEKGGKRLKHLVDSLVDISKIDYGKFELEMNSEDISEIIRECSNEITYLLKNRKINLNLSIPDSLYIKIDRIRMEQVIINLLSNAIKNSPPNGEVNVILKNYDDWVELIVSDMGIGLTKEEVYSLFTRFGKIERVGEGFEYLDIQGSGLGLFIAQEIVKLHRGEIKVLSDGRNKGAKFIVRLPYH